MSEPGYTREEITRMINEARHPHPLATESPASPPAATSTALARNTVGMPVPVLKRNLAIEGLENLTFEEDLILPRWRIVQYSSTIEGKPGQFNNNLTGELRNELRLIVLKIVPSRARFNDERKLVCMSSDGIRSSDGRLCAGCPYAQWGEDGEPPACSRGYTLVCLDPKSDDLCLVGALRTSVPAVKRLISLLFHKKEPPFVFLTRLTATDAVSPKGKYFVINIELQGENDPDAVRQYREHYHSLANVRIQEVEEPVEDSASPDDWGQEPIPF